MTTENKNIWDIKDKELLNLILGREGGETTIRIIDTIIKQPYNRNQITNILNLDYKTINYHLNILCKYKYATKEKLGNSYYYHPSKKLFNHMEEYKLIKEFLKK